MNLCHFYTQHYQAKREQRINPWPYIDLKTITRKAQSYHELVIFYIYKKASKVKLITTLKMKAHCIISV